MTEQAAWGDQASSEVVRDDQMTKQQGTWVTRLAAELVKDDQTIEQQAVWGQQASKGGV